MINKETNLVWIDLEMTGLHPEKDVILEIATIITDSELNILNEGPELVIHQSDAILDSMEPWPKKEHARSGLTEKVRASAINLGSAERQTLEVIKNYCAPQKAVLCGNSIWQDRAFLYKYMPQLLAYLHYRMIDVSTIKELVARWYPESPYKKYKKTDTHRALADIRESIAELQHLRQHFFK